MVVFPITGNNGLAETSIEIPPNLVSPNTFSADCAVALVKNDTPLLRFVQLHAVQDGVATKVLHVRYSWEAFKRQLVANIALCERIEATASAWRLRSTPLGHYAELARNVASNENLQSLTLDADFDYMANHGSRSSTMHLSLDPRELVAMARGTHKQLRMTAQVSITIPSAALVDMIRSWNTLAEEIGL